MCFRLSFSKHSPLAKNKDLYNQVNPKVEWLTDNEISDYSHLFNVITIIFNERDKVITSLFGNFTPGSVPENTKVIFIHANGHHYSTVQTPTKKTIMSFKDAAEIFVEELSNVSGGRRYHSTRRHSVRFKPSRFKTQRTN